MEERGEEGRDVGIPNSSSFSPPQDSPVKLPLYDRRGNTAVSTRRRGSSIFSPTQTLDHHHFCPSPPRIPNPDPPISRNQSPPQAPLPPRPSGGGVSTSSVIRYKECLKNHAASMGGHVVDGCGEFMPSGDDGTPQALRCAACDCHRNFHRREAEGQPHPQPFHYSSSSYPNSGSNRQTSSHHHHQKHSYPQGLATMVSFGSGGAAMAMAMESSSEDLNMFQHQPSYSGAAKKRFRTKFRQDQKHRMHEFATKLGWRIQKQDEQELQDFCSQVGVKRQAFKIWMHNNKQKKSSSQT